MIDVKTLWVQECIKNIIVHKIGREEIPVDALASASSANHHETHEHSLWYTARNNSYMTFVLDICILKCAAEQGVRLRRNKT